MSDAFEIIGLYFQHHTGLEMGIGTLLVRGGIARYPFHGIVSFLINHESSMVDSLGPTKPYAFWEDGEKGWGYTKQYTEPKTHNQPIQYYFTERSTDGSYWIGEYQLANGSAWGEAHAVLRPISLDEADTLLRRHETATKTVILDETIRAFDLFPKSIMHLSRLPQVFNHGDDGTLPRIEEQAEDVRLLCTDPMFRDHSLPEAWVEVYCFIEKMAGRMSCSWNDVLQQARDRAVQEGSLLNALRSMRSEVDLESHLEQYTVEYGPDEEDDSGE